MKLDEAAWAKAHGFLAAVAYGLCVIGFWLFPRMTLWLFDSWFHGVDLTSLPVKVGPLVTILIGGVTFSGAGWMGGYLTAVLYNQFLKK